MKKNNEFWLALSAIGFTIVVAVVAFLIGYTLNNGYTQHQFKIFDQAYKILNENGLKPMPPEQVIEYEMIRGMVKAYDDPYTVFVAPPEHEIETQNLEGKYGGVGAALQRDTQGKMRIYPYPESPAAQAGVPAGSQLVQVDSLIVDTSSPDDQVIAGLRGKIGSKVTISVLPPETTVSAQYTIDRQEFGIPSVSWQLVPEDSSLGIVKITSISATTSAEITKAINEVQTRGAKTIILDLRDNGGGLVDAGVDVVKLFMPAGSDLLVQHYPGKPEHDVKALTNGKFVDLPIYVFVNNNTASSAEIVAGVLQETRRAKVIGKQSYGKDTIQLVFDLNDGSSIHVTAARWTLPGNPAFTTGAGILPDIPLPQEAPSDADYIRALLDELKQKTP